MTLALLLAAIVAWSPNLRDDDSAGEAEKIAAAVMAGAERESLDPLVVAAVIAQESGFDADPCNRRVALDRVISREPVEGHADREQLSWTCGSSAGTRRTCERTVWQVEEHDGYLYLDTCPAGEVGYMQVLRSSEWARAGYAIPGTEFDWHGRRSSWTRPTPRSASTTCLPRARRWCSPRRSRRRRRNAASS
jgi:hypothetical protein